MEELELTEQQFNDLTQMERDYFFDNQRRAINKYFNSKENGKEI